MKLLEELEELKTQHGIKTDAEFAEFIGIDPTSYSRYKTGKRNLSWKDGKKIIKRFPWLKANVVAVFL